MRFALGLRDWMLSILSIILLLWLVFWISAFFYGSFYFSFMPSQQSFSKKIDLVFETCSQDERCSGLRGNVSLDQELNLVRNVLIYPETILI